jgi:hypothetical protein
MERDDIHELAIKQVHGTHMRMAEAYSVADNRFENRLQIEGGAANDFEHFSGSGLLLLCLIALAFKQRDLRFLASGRGTTPTHGLWPIAALWRHYLAVWRFSWLAACFEVPSHRLPQGSGQGIVAGRLVLRYGMFAAIAPVLRWLIG